MESFTSHRETLSYIFGQLSFSFISIFILIDIHLKNKKDSKIINFQQSKFLEAFSSLDVVLVPQFLLLQNSLVGFNSLMTAMSLFVSHKRSVYESHAFILMRFRVKTGNSCCLLPSPSAE